jgi:hypothetical protein
MYLSNTPHLEHKESNQNLTQISQDIWTSLAQMQTCQPMIHNKQLLIDLQVSKVLRFQLKYSISRVRECNKNTWRRRETWLIASSKRTIWSHLTAPLQDLILRNRFRSLQARTQTQVICISLKTRRLIWVQATTRTRVTFKIWKKSSRRSLTRTDSRMKQQG